MKTSRGLSLIEVTIVLVIIGLLLGGLLIPLSAQMDQQKIELTKKRLEEIKEALLGFAIIYNRLPCPAKYSQFDKEKPIITKDAGKEELSFCGKKIEGYLPWKDLGVGRYDGWNNPFRYRPEDEYTETPIVSNISNGLQVANIKGNSLTTSSKFRVAAIIFSCGKNGIPDPTSSDKDKTNDGDADRNTKITCENEGTWKQRDVYIQDSYVENSFDDILTWLSKNTLMNRLVAAGKWPPP